MPNAFYIMLAKVIVLRARLSSLVLESNNQSFYTETEHQIEIQMLEILFVQNLN
jgi:hypothetical protein